MPQLTNLIRSIAEIRRSIAGGENNVRVTLGNHIKRQSRQEALRLAIFDRVQRLQLPIVIGFFLVVGALFPQAFQVELIRKQKLIRLRYFCLKGCLELVPIPYGKIAYSVLQMADHPHMRRCTELRTKQEVKTP